MATAPENHPAAADEAVYPIRTISNLTGVNAVTLRAWERRYNLIRPQRTPKGHRLYTQADVDRARSILQTEYGFEANVDAYIEVLPPASADC